MRGQGTPRRGAALIMAMFFMAILFGVGLAFIRLIPGEYYAAQRLQTDTAGYYAADAGVSAALAWLESIGPQGVATNDNGDWLYFNAAYPALPTSSPNPILAGIKNLTTNPSAPAAPSPGGAWTQCSNVATALLPGWHFEAQVQRWNFRDADNNTGTFFVIVSEAKRHSRTGSGLDSFRRVRCWARPASFADDAYAVDRIATGTNIWLNLNNFRLTGPYRTNDRVLLYTENASGSGGYWPRPSPSPGASPPGPAINGAITYWKGDPQASPAPWENRYKKDGTLSNVNDDSDEAQIVDGVKYSSHSNQDYLPYNKTTGAELPGRYADITANGRNGITATNNRQDMPTNTENLADIALGIPAPSPGVALAKTNVATSVFNNTSTINLHASSTSGGLFGKTLTSGFYVEGNVDNITLTTPTAPDGNGNPSDGNYNSAMRIRQGSSSANIIQVYESFTLPAGAIINGQSPLGAAQTLSASTNGAGYTLVQDVSNPNVFTVYEGAGNGAYFINGDINAFSGRNRGRKTFATRTDTGSSTTYDKSITINGNVTRADTPAGSNVTGVRDQLGFLSYKVKLADNSKLMKDDGTSATRSATTVSDPLLIYGAFVLGRLNDPNDHSQDIGGGFGSVNAYDNAQGQGNFRLFGSLTEGVRQIKGVIGQSGNSYQYIYDPNLSTVPPPFFPQKSRFRIDAWNEEAVYNY